MHHPITILELVFVLVSCTLAARRFKDEYPNVTVCESTLTTDVVFYDMPYSYRFLKALFMGNHKCTHIEGHLIIKNIWPDGEKLDFSFLEEIEEVSGVVQMINNTIDSIILPKLKVIRGNNCNQIRWNDSRSYGVSLYMQADDPDHAGHLILPSLKAISNHSVYFNSKLVHPYLPYSVRWEEFFDDENAQRLLTVQKPKDRHQCHRSCSMFKEDSNRTFCWSPHIDHCQERTKCKKQDDGDPKWCYSKEFENESIEINCHPLCTGGCSGTGEDQCYVCKQYINGDKCTSSCPPEYISQNGQKTKNPKFRLRVAMICATTCPNNLLQQEDACIYKCTSPDFYRVKDKCEECKNKDRCNPKECIIEDPKSCDPHDTSSFFMTKTILERLTECEHVIGQLHFSDESFDKSRGQITVPMLYKHLKNIRTVTGNVVVDGTMVQLHNLTFLRNLEEIRHLKQKQCKRQSDTALNIFFTDLKFLGLQRLRRVFGDFSDYDNVHMCYLETISWYKHVLIQGQFRSNSKDCDKPCDPQCGTEGCWGPTNSMCFICRGVRAGYNCVDKCEDEPGYYTGDGIIPTNHRLPISYDDGTCRMCNPLCRGNCTGPSSADCIGGCRFFKERNKCVRSCSRTSYLIGKTCQPCSVHCLNDSKIEHVCNGGGDYIGKGGCSACNDFIWKDATMLCYQGKCPDGYYAEINARKSKICRPCTRPCSKCISRSIHRHDCITCMGFWERDKCVHRCSNDTSDLVQPTNIGATCQVCHDQCIGCTGHDDDQQCVTCRNKRIYLQPGSHKFRCVATCPSTHNYTYQSNYVDVCITNEEGQARDYIEQRRKLLNVIFWILGPSIATLLIASAIIYQMFRKNMKTKSTNYLKAVYSNIHEPDSRVLLFNRESSLAQPNMNRLLLIPTTNIIFDIHGKPLGKGAFGCVYRGIWRLTHDNGAKKDRNELDVAIKVIEVVSQKGMEDLLTEAKVMASVSHKHCLRLIGVCLLQKQPCLVTTYMELGSLDRYLKKYRDTLSSFTLLSWAEQIANGMAYLEMRGIIHRDLATRNVLLNSSQLVQITDFGLSRILQGTEDNQEIVVTSGQVPIRWLAPETLTMGVYSHKTDVWSYGVTLWEIFSYGERPYNDMAVKDISGFLSQKYRLSQPEICSLETYAEMLNCWKEPQYRSTFEELMLKFSEFSQHPTYYLNIPNDPCLLSSQYMGEDSDGTLPKGRNKAFMWKSLYKQLPSLDGTIVTCLEEYPDNDNNSRVKRQSSNLSYLSGRIIFSDNHENISPLLFQASTLSEIEDTDDGYLQPKNTKLVNLDDHEYIEPITKDFV